jgi:MFS family permease
MIEADPATRDLRTLYLAAFLRALATGMVGVLVGLYLARLGFDELEMGSVITVGLGGAALAALVVTLGAHRLGHRSTLVVLSLLGAAGGVVVATSSATAVISAAAFVGMLNGMGRDRGAALILDQAILPATVSDAERTKAFAWYNVMQDAGHALGSVLAAAPAVVQALSGASELGGFRASLLLYASIHLVTAGVYTRLGSGAAHTPRRQPARISPESRRVLWKISSLFVVDSLAGGFLTTALLSFFFHERFGAGPVAVGALFFLARVANAFSHLGAAWLARRIGLVNTMVFTHIPSSLLLLTVPFAPSFSVAAVLFVLREGLVEMDVPTRQSYVMAVVRPDERTFASGITHLVRLASWAVAPAFAGLLMRSLALGAPLFVGASMKIAYDLLLYAAFRHHRPPEERDR